MLVYIQNKSVFSHDGGSCLETSILLTFSIIIKFSDHSGLKVVRGAFLSKINVGENLIKTCAHIV